MTKEEILGKLVKDLEVRGRSIATTKLYVAAATRFQEHFDRSADKMGETEICEFLHYLATVRKLKPGSVNDYNTALRFVYGVTLEANLNLKLVPRMRETRRIPQIFTREEVHSIIDSAGTLINKSMFMLAYGSGLRLSEITNLRVADIESTQMRILVRHGKGDRDRYAILPQVTLETLREYWRAYHPKEWLFVAPKKGGAYAAKTLYDAFKSALKRSGVTKPGTIHFFRHCFATHLYEDGCGLLELRDLLGHARISTTAWYTQLADTRLRRVVSPIDTLMAHSGKPHGGGCANA